MFGAYTYDLRPDSRGLSRFESLQLHHRLHSKKTCMLIYNVWTFANAKSWTKKNVEIIGKNTSEKIRMGEETAVASCINGSN